MNLLKVVLLPSIFFFLNLGWSQTFDAGSTGADGALDLSSYPPGSVVDFGPKTMGFSEDHDNVFNYTYINIPADVTLRCSARTFNAPVIWLAQDSVKILGTLNLSGERGHTDQTFFYPFPGSGGYTGGLGRVQLQNGGGPFGGLGRSNYYGDTGGLGVNRYLIPIFGGSGGGGASHGGTGGGAGAGGILIACNKFIEINGVINASGGHGTCPPSGCYPANGSGGGSGGAIKVVAHTISGNGRIDVSGGSSPLGTSSGTIRIEAFRDIFGGTMPTGSIWRSPPNLLFVDVSRRTPPRIRVTSIAGVSVPDTVTASFDIPDVVFAQSSAVDFQIEAKYIPPGTTATLYLISVDGNNQVITSTPLEGTLGLSTASASTVIPTGYSRGFIRSTWTP